MGMGVPLNLTYPPLPFNSTGMVTPDLTGNGPSGLEEVRLACRVGGYRILLPVRWSKALTLPGKTRMSPPPPGSRPSSRGS